MGSMAARGLGMTMNADEKGISAPCLPMAVLMGCFPAASGDSMVRAGAWMLMLMLFCWMTAWLVMRAYPPLKFPSSLPPSL